MVNKLTVLQALMPFLNQPKEKLHLADISRSLKEPHTTVRLWLNNLEQEGVLKKEFKGRLTLYGLNFNNLNIIDYLVMAEKLNSVALQDKWLVLKELCSFIQLNIQENSKALIFGSTIELLNKAKDIDILIIGKSPIKSRNFSKYLNKDLHSITVKSLEDVSHALKQEIVKKHLIITGSEDIVRWMIWQQLSGVRRKKQAYD